MRALIISFFLLWGTLLPCFAQEYAPFELVEAVKMEYFMRSLKKDQNLEGMTEEELSILLYKVRQIGRQ